MPDTATRSRSLLKPLVSGVVLLAALVVIIALRTQIADLISHAGSKGSNSLWSWIPDHPKQFTVMVAAFLLFLVFDWVGHIVGRLRAWIFVVVVEIGLWILFWNSVGIPALRDMVGLKGVGDVGGTAQIVSLLIILVLSGVVFWILEAKEAWSARRARTGGGD